MARKLRTAVAGAAATAAMTGALLLGAAAPASASGGHDDCPRKCDHGYSHTHHGHGHGHGKWCYDKHHGFYYWLGVVKVSIR
ncbi:hypothetical protein [Nocardiopsis composta]|uniref:Spy/CpxP family protein refolding chaperone n=1 Tax=Nocardiopsis composta TaxID=157465 RepID=A0A7W8VHF7_9ACTN|nr:hypothetical protein [Nocardiopsis composta]MBB5436120.1 Spy/CpxP family protein refolding chaperone [Nocardiopsis composta]